MTKRATGPESDDEKDMPSPLGTDSSDVEAAWRAEWKAVAHNRKVHIAAPHYRTISPPSSTSTSTSTIAFALGDNLTPNPSPTHLTAVV
jgi:hypothetical protein